MLHTIFLIHRSLPWAARFVTNEEIVIQCIKRIFCLFTFSKQSSYEPAFECIIKYDNIQYHISITNRETVSVRSVDEVCGYIAHLAFMPDYIRNEAYVYLHGASLVNKMTGKAIGLIGATGSGKTTLCTTLLCSGQWEYLSDDIIVLDANDGCIIPWAKCMYIREKCHIQKLSNATDFLTNQQIVLSFNGETKSVVAPKICYTPPKATLDRIYFINRDQLFPQCSIEKVSASDAFPRLLKNLRDPVYLKVNDIISVVKKNLTYDLKYDESERAVRLLNGVSNEY